MMSFARAFARCDDAYLIDVKIHNRRGELVADLNADSRDLWRFDNWIGRYYIKDGIMIFNAVQED